MNPHKTALLKHLNRYEFVNMGPLLCIFPVLVLNTLKKYFNVYSEVCMEGRMIQGLLAINWFRIGLEDGDQKQNIKLCCEYNF